MARPLSQYKIGDSYLAGTIVGDAPRDRSGQRCVRFECATPGCGRIAVCRLSQLKTGVRKSCRCLMVKRFSEHTKAELSMLTAEQRQDIASRVEGNERTSSIGNRYGISHYAVQLCWREWKDVLIALPVSMVNVITRRIHGKLADNRRPNCIVAKNVYSTLDFGGQVSPLKPGVRSCVWLTGDEVRFIDRYARRMRPQKLAECNAMRTKLDLIHFPGTVLAIEQYMPRRSPTFNELQAGEHWKVGEFDAGQWCMRKDRKTGIKKAQGFFAPVYDALLLYTLDDIGALYGKTVRSAAEYCVQLFLDTQNARDAVSKRIRREKGMERLAKSQREHEEVFAARNDHYADLFAAA